MRILLISLLFLLVVGCDSNHSSLQLSYSDAIDERVAQAAYDLLHGQPISIGNYIDLKSSVDYGEIVPGSVISLRDALERKGVTLLQVQQFLDLNRNKVRAVVVP